MTQRGIREYDAKRLLAQYLKNYMSKAIYMKAFTKAGIVHYVNRSGRKLSW